MKQAELPTETLLSGTTMVIWWIQMWMLDGLQRRNLQLEGICGTDKYFLKCSAGKNLTWSWLERWSHSSNCIPEIRNLLAMYNGIWQLTLGSLYLRIGKLTKSLGFFFEWVLVKMNFPEAKTLLKSLPLWKRNAWEISSTHLNMEEGKLSHTWLWL